MKATASAILVTTLATQEAERAGLTDLEITPEQLRTEREVMCAPFGGVVEAERKLLSGELPWGCILCSKLQRYRALLGEPAIGT